MMTAEEFLKCNCVNLVGSNIYDGVTPEIMIEFANIHVTEALKQASDEAELDYYEGNCRECQSNKINKESILKSYPLENIK